MSFHFILHIFHFSLSESSHIDWNQIYYIYFCEKFRAAIWCVWKKEKKNIQKMLKASDTAETSREVKLGRVFMFCVFPWVFKCWKKGDCTVERIAIVVHGSHFFWTAASESGSREMEIHRVRRGRESNSSIDFNSTQLSLRLVARGLVSSVLSKLSSSLSVTCSIIRELLFTRSRRCRWVALVLLIWKASTTRNELNRPIFGRLHEATRPPHAPLALSLSFVTRW